jgi:hypothetical protein
MNFKTTSFIIKKVYSKIAIPLNKANFFSLITASISKNILLLRHCLTIQFRNRAKN